LALSVKAVVQKSQCADGGVSRWFAVQNAQARLNLIFILSLFCSRTAQLSSLQLGLFDSVVPVPVRGSAGAFHLRFETPKKGEAEDKGGGRGPAVTLQSLNSIFTSRDASIRMNGLSRHKPAEKTMMSVTHYDDGSNIPKQQNSTANSRVEGPVLFCRTRPNSARCDDEGHMR
jgi:hypothetical protein